MKRALSNYCRIATIEFDAKAVSEYIRLKEQRVRIGTMGLKITAIALANNAAVITRNAKDFSRVPALKLEDWSV